MRESSQKIMALEEIAKAVAQDQQQGLAVVHCHGEFDLLHFGHMRYFKRAREMGQKLVVTLTPDRFIAKGPGRPVYNQDQRAEAIANLECVDYVGINQWPTAEETLRLIKPNVYAKGDEYLKKVDTTGRLQKEKDIIESLGGQMMFTTDIVFSSSKLLNNHFQVFTPQSQAFLSDLAQRREGMQLVESLKVLKDKKILLLGEPRVNQISWVKAADHSQPLPLVTKKEYTTGGAMLGLRVLAEFCDHLELVSLKGSHGSVIKKLVPEGVKVHWIKSEATAFPTTQRYLPEKGGEPLFQLNHQEASPLEEKAEQELLALLKERLPQVDLVLVYDLSLGMITPKVAQLLAQKAPWLAVTPGGCGLSPKEAPLLKYRNLDFVLSGKAHLLPDLKSIASLPFASLDGLAFRQAHQVTLVAQNRFCLWLEGGEFKNTPAFTEERHYAHPLDGVSIAFSLLAPLVQAGVEPELLKLYGNAVLSMANSYKETNFHLDRLLFEKFLIALLNR